MSRYNGNYRNDGMSTFAEVTLGILAATLIIATVAGGLLYMKAKAEEEMIIAATRELTRPFREADLLPSRHTN